MQCGGVRRVPHQPIKSSEFYYHSEEVAMPFLSSYILFVVLGTPAEATEVSMTSCTPKAGEGRVYFFCLHGSGK